MPQDRGSRAIRACLSFFGVLVLILILCIVLQVILTALGFSTLIRLEEQIFLLGRAVTINSLMDIQWHLLVVIGLLPAGLVWLLDRHVRVDFLYRSAPARGKATIELIGHVLFTLPFLIFCTPAAWSFAQRALATAERSRDGGLTDRFLIKGVIPVGFALILLVLLLDIVIQSRRLWKGDQT